MKIIKKISRYIEKSIDFLNKNFRKILIYGAGGILLINFIFSDYGLIVMIKNYFTKKEVKAKIIKEDIMYDSLNTRINKLKFDTTEIERIARETYGMVKQNEKLYIYKEKKEDE